MQGPFDTNAQFNARLDNTGSQLINPQQRINKMSATQEALKGLGVVVDTLEAQVKALEEGLSMVLGRGTSGLEKEPATTGRETTCSLSMAILNEQDRVAAVCRQLALIQDRLEL